MDLSATTENAFLGGKVRARQFSVGFRSGLDAVLLAAAVTAKRGRKILELGSGAGVAALCLAARVPECEITGVEIDARLVELANQNAAANSMGGRVRFVEADALKLPRELRSEYDQVMCNPPFHREGCEVSPDEARSRALQDYGRFPQWIETGVKRTGPKGSFTTVMRADRLAEALAILPPRGVTVFPLWPKPNIPAKRVLVRLKRGDRTPLVLLPGLVLHQEDGCYTPETEAILRDGAPLEIAESRR